MGFSQSFRGQVGFSGIQRIILLVVNAPSSSNTDWDQHEYPPGIIGQLLQSPSVPIDRYSFDTIELIKDSVESAKLRGELIVARARLAGATEVEAEADVPKIELYTLAIEFDQITDPEERDYFKNLPTSFVLPAEYVDRLRAVAGHLLRTSKTYKALLQELGVGVLGRIKVPYQAFSPFSEINRILKRNIQDKYQGITLINSLHHLFNTLFCYRSLVPNCSIAFPVISIHTLN